MPVYRIVDENGEVHEFLDYESALECCKKYPNKLLICWKLGANFVEQIWKKEVMCFKLNEGFAYTFKDLEGKK